MVGRFLSLLILPVLSGLLLLLSFPRFDLQALAWIALVPLLLAVRTSSGKAAFGQGWLAGVVFFAGALAWVVVAMHQYGQVPLVLSYVVMLLLASYCALYVGLFTAVLRFIGGRNGWLLVWSAPALWVILELARTHLFSGFPWALLGYSQYRSLPVIQIAEITGVYGVSFVLILGNMLVAKLGESLLSRVRLTARLVPVSWITVLFAAGVLAGVMSYGAWRLAPTGESHNDHRVRIGLVQGNIDQAQKWDVAFRRETVDRYKRLTAQIAPQVDLVVWPEAATPFLFELEAGYRDDLLTFVRGQGVPLLFGSPATVPNRQGTQLRLSNSAFLISRDGAVLDRYDKIHLVPFGEYVPLREIFSFLDKLVVGIGDFFPGTGPEVMTGPGGRFGVVICFEVIFPDLVRQFVEQGADYMLTITNDAWFGRSSAPYQHFAMVVLRAVENRVAFARAANTGISGFIDAHGQILKVSDLFVEDALVGQVRTGGPRTFYTAYGDVFAYGCGILTALALIWRRKTVP